MGLDEHLVDLFEVDGAGLVAHGFNEAGEAEVAGSAQEAFAGSDDQGQGVVGEGVVAQGGAVELGEDELLGFLGAQAGKECRIGDTGADFLVDG